MRSGPRPGPATSRSVTLAGRHVEPLVMGPKSSLRGSDGYLLVIMGGSGQGRVVLEKPAWAALSGPQACFAEAAGDAARFPSDMSPFAGLADLADPAAWRDLATL